MPKYNRERLHSIATKALNTTSINSLKKALDDVFAPVHEIVVEARDAKELASGLRDIEREISAMDSKDPETANELREMEQDRQIALNAKKGIADKKSELSAVESKVSNLLSEVRRAQSDLRG